MLNSDKLRSLSIQQHCFTRRSHGSFSARTAISSEKQRQTSQALQIPRPGTRVKRPEIVIVPEQKPRLWRKLIEEYRKNYCPRRSPPLVLPTPPTETEKYAYMQMKRPFLLSCHGIALISLLYGASRFASASPIYSWFALLVSLSELYIISGLFVAILGKEFDPKSHAKLLENHSATAGVPPTVDIYLPVCREPLEVVENTWKYIAALQYPPEKLSVFVLDDGADKAVESLAKRFEYHYLCRPNRPDLRKAGNLRHAFAQSSGDFHAVFDADFCPRPDFLHDTLPYLLADEKLAILQTPQYFRSLKEQTWTEQGAGALIQYFYRIMQPCRDRWGAAICAGSNAVYRRAAFEPIGGTFPAKSSEDIYTGLYASTHGWSVKFIALNLCCGVCPDTPRAFFSQQMRWCYGTMTMLTYRGYWKGNTTIKIKLCFLIGFMSYVTSAIEPFIFPLIGPFVLLTRPDLFKYYNLFFAFPCLILGFLGSKLWARGRYPVSVLYADRILAFACLQGIWDFLTGNNAGWKPSGGASTAQKNDRYRNMRILAWGWTITHEIALIAAAVYRVAGGEVAWYNLIPALIIDIFSLVCIHHFLLYQHPKE